MIKLLSTMEPRDISQWLNGTVFLLRGRPVLYGEMHHPGDLDLDEEDEDIPNECIVTVGPLTKDSLTRSMSWLDITLPELVEAASMWWPAPGYYNVSPDFCDAGVMHMERIPLRHWRRSYWHRAVAMSLPFAKRVLPDRGLNQSRAAWTMWDADYAISPEQVLTQPGPLALSRHIALGPLQHGGRTILRNKREVGSLLVGDIRCSIKIHPWAGRRVLAQVNKLIGGIGL